MNEINQEEITVRLLYKNLLQYWNNADAKGYASLFADDANLIGFDGSQVNGSAEIEKHLAGIFANHKTASYISIVRQVRFLSPEIVILCAVAGMVPPGKTDINPATNAIQTAVLQKKGSAYQLAVFQNTPAAFHGRPEDAENLTNELRKALELAKDV
ncbi:MAG: SgcJ/EcaC family oxidoreductase [Chitinophagaceae bacterium]